MAIFLNLKFGMSIGKVFAFQDNCSYSVKHSPCMLLYDRIPVLVVGTKVAFVCLCTCIYIVSTFFAGYRVQHNVLYVVGTDYVRNVPYLSELLLLAHP